MDLIIFWPAHSLQVPTDWATLYSLSCLEEGCQLAHDLTDSDSGPSSLCLLSAKFPPLRLHHLPNTWHTSTSRQDVTSFNLWDQYITSPSTQVDMLEESRSSATPVLTFQLIPQPSHCTTWWNINSDTLVMPRYKVTNTWRNGHQFTTASPIIPK